ncbi:MAG TPA: methylated-DNA--[protein]-cysteine S-methyltransferase [Actinomycetota bacterium]|nr:methylated-DNA--[protein]-cysteine S-methyltransferase [Actinomycetota bacterium]
MSGIEEVLGARRDVSGAAARAAARVADRARDDGLTDVLYAEVPSPFGSLLVASTRRGLVRLAYPDESVDSVLERLAARVSPRILEGPLDRERRELEEYFESKRDRFEVPVDLSMVAGFGRKVLRATARIPYGRVLTYREVAARAGSPRGSRAAGNALGANPIPIVVPCHRVVATGGGLGGYTGGIDRKEFLLRLEGHLAQ